MPKLKIYGSQELPRLLDEDKGLSVAFMEMEFRKIEKDKGSDDITYKVDNIGEVIIKQGEEVIKTGADKFPQKLRGAMYYIHSENNIEVDFEEWRETFKKKILANLDEVYQLLSNK